MCGIFGAFNFDRQSISEGKIKAMASSISHRGPDAMGYFQGEFCTIGNTRLSIIDLSAASDQPMYSENGDIVLVQNGEIYNFVELRDELERHGCKFKTTGDTEVLLNAYQKWGPDFVTRINGMFTIAIFDKSQNKLRLYRDRLGVKPLYISDASFENTIWFGSEIKAILEAGYIVTPDVEALASYFALNYIPQPQTMFQGIRHLPPAHMAEISADGSIVTKRYWKLDDVRTDSDMTLSEAKSGIIRILDDATRIRMRADADFGAFLSGGLDSSSVCGFMRLYQTEPLRSFSIGFDDGRFDESKFAKMASERFGMIQEVEIASSVAVENWPHAIWHCDQPHGDISFIPTGQVSGMASKRVKMVLTGDGGDELFAGYEKYLDMFPNGNTDHLKVGWEDEYTRQSGLLVGDQAEMILSGELKDAFFDIDPYAALSGAIKSVPHYDPINRLLFAETVTLLPGNNLVKPDRMAMAHSLEVRSPYLDYRMAEFAFQIPGRFKLEDGETKSVLKKALLPYLGQTLTYRKKQMFTVPVGEWFRKELSKYCHEMLLDGRLEKRRFFDMEAVAEMLSKHIEGVENYTRQLRALIALEIWFRLFLDKDDAWRNKANVSASHII